MRISILRGVQRLAALGGRAASGRRPPPPPCTVAPPLFSIRSRFSSSSRSGPAADCPTAATTGQSPPDSGAQTRRLASPRERYERDVASAWVWASDRFDVDMLLDAVVGNVRDLPWRDEDPGAVELARSAVAEHNIKTNAALEFVRLVKVRRQVGAALMYYVTVEVREAGGAKKLYEAKVLDKPWEEDMSYEQLRAFESVVDAAEGKEDMQ